MENTKQANRNLYLANSVILMTISHTMMRAQLFFLKYKIRNIIKGYLRRRITDNVRILSQFLNQLIVDVQNFASNIVAFMLGEGFSTEETDKIK